MGLLYPSWPLTVRGGRVTGSANAIEVFPQFRVDSYFDGLSIRFEPTADNTGNVTLNVNGLGAKFVRKGSGNSNLASGDLEEGKVAWLQYDGTRFKLISSEGETRGRYRFFRSSKVTGSANAIVVTSTRTLPAYSAGQQYEFPAKFTCTGACTINIDGRGVKAHAAGSRRHPGRRNLPCRL